VKHLTTVCRGSELALSSVCALWAGWGRALLCAVLLCPFRRAMAVFVKHHIHITFFFCFLAISPHTQGNKRRTAQGRRPGARV
jgi:hypothetical protein